MYEPVMLRPSSTMVSMVQAAMVAKLDTSADQAAAKGMPLDDERADSGESQDESPSSADKQNSATLGRGPAQKRAKKQPEAVWESACKLPKRAAPHPSQPPQASTRMMA